MVYGTQSVDYLLLSGCAEHEIQGTSVQLRTAAGAGRPVSITT